MKASEFLGGYDVGAQSDIYGQAVRAKKDETAIFKIGHEIEERGRLFGEVILAVTETAEYLADLETPEEKVQSLQGDTDRWEFFTRDLIPRVNDYNAWLRQSFPVLNDRVRQNHTSGSKELSEHAARISQHLFFHVLNEAAEEQWWSYIDQGVIGGEPPKRTLNANIGSLAVVGMMIIQQRVFSIRKNGNGRDGYLTSTHNDEERGALEGMLNEVDGGIALLESSITQPDERYWVLPAPPQFEYLAGKKNTDFIVAASKSSKMLGAQIKSSGQVKTADSGTTNPYLVTISGRYDLGNSVDLPRETGGNSRPSYQTHSFAGTLALAAAARLPKSSQDMLKIRGNPTFRAALAAMHSKKRGSQLKNAADRVGFVVAGSL